MKRQSVINYPHRDLEAEKWAALYVRLSRDDDNEGDSNSIAHQIEILKKYAKDHNITRYKVYKDDGFSGKNFNRPGFQEMLSDIENGLVSTVIVKDISRFGRNYIEVGMYTESAFRCLTCGLCQILFTSRSCAHGRDWRGRWPAMCSAFSRRRNIW